MIGALIVLIFLAQGVAANCANEETLVATWDGIYIVSTSSNFCDNTKYYQVWYYPPNNYPGGVHFTAEGSFSGIGTHIEQYNPGDPVQEGTWTVVLMKGGSSKSEPVALDSVRVVVEVNIPEFPTIALPIAAVIGLLLLFQRRKKKEE